MTTNYEMPPIQANGKTPTGAAKPNVHPIAQAAPVVAPAPIPKVPAIRRPGILTRIADWTREAIAEERKRADKGRSIWGEHPPSLAVLREWYGTTRWARSEAQLKRTVAWIDSHLIAMPVTALLYILAWIVQRPLRRLVALILLLIIIHYL